jgi:hypothetical protein
MRTIDCNLKINGGTLTSLVSLGLRIESRTLMNQEVDTVSLVQWCASRETGPVLAARQRIELIRTSGLRWFTGHVSAPQRILSSNAVGWRYTLLGPWWVLQETLNYLRHTDVAGTSNALSAQYELVRQHVADRIPTLASLDEWPAELPDRQVRPMLLTTSSVSDNLRGILKMYLTACTRWDYTASVPTMSLSLIGYDPVMIYRGTAADQVYDLQLARRDDLTPDHTVIRVVGEITQTDASTDYIWGRSYVPSIQLINEAGSGYDGDLVGPGVANLIYYEGDLLRIYDGYEFPSGVAAQVAEDIHETLTVPMWEGTLSLVGTETGIRPGTELRVTGGDEAMETAQLIVQRVDEDLVRQTTTVKVGWTRLIDSRSLSDMLITWLKYWARKGIVAPSIDELPEYVP